MPQDSLPDCNVSGCQEKALSFSSVCWTHADKKAYLAQLSAALKTLSRARFALNLKKVECDYLDFSGLDLQGSSFSQAEFSNALFIGANLSGSDLIGARFRSCDFVGSELHDSNFTRAIFANCSFSHSDFKNSCFLDAHFKEVDFMNAGLCNAIIWNADLSGAKNLKRKNFNDPAPGPRKLRSYLSEINSIMAYESYRGLKHYFYQKGLYDDASWAAYRERTMERKHFFEIRDIRFFPSLLMDILSGYTEKPARVVLSSFGCIFVFGLVYHLLQALRPTVDSGTRLGWWDSLYFSFITFTTVGFGDIVPKAFWWVRALVSLEAFSGPFMAGLFIFTLTRRYTAG